MKLRVRVEVEGPANLDECKGRQNKTLTFLDELRGESQNARLFTGPKTEAGRSHSRRNALKHGVLASALLIGKGGGEEDASEFDELFRALNRDLAPVGRLEEMMVEKIAVCW